MSDQELDVCQEAGEPGEAGEALRSSSSAFSLVRPQDKISPHFLPTSSTPGTGSSRVGVKLELEFLCLKMKVSTGKRKSQDIALLHTCRNNFL